MIAAECGSFLSAAKKLYISGNAVAKQIDRLENDLGLRLFQRGPHGLVLTPAGEVIYKETKRLMEDVDRVLERAREAEGRQNKLLRVGTSLTCSAEYFFERYGEAINQCDVFFEIIPYLDTAPAFLELIGNLGKSVDFVVGLYENKYWKEQYQTAYLTEMPFCVACAGTHPLAGRKRLRPDELQGQTIVVCRDPKNSPSFARACSFLQGLPGVRLDIRDYADYALFNELAGTTSLMLSFPCWSGVHPRLKTVAVDWGFSVPYGIMYQNPTPCMKYFLGRLQQAARCGEARPAAPGM